MKKIVAVLVALAALAVIAERPIRVFAQSYSITLYGARLGVSDTQVHTIPVVASDTVALLAASQTFTNKTLTGNIASNFSNTGTVTLFTATDTVVGKATTDTLTNKTLDAEGTGNVVTYPSLVSFPAANCNNVTATTTWSLPATNPAVATCFTGTNTNFGTLNYPDGANRISSQILLPVPADFTGNLDARLLWFANATTGAAKWDISTVCVNNTTIDPAFNTASTVTTTTNATANAQNSTAFTSITITGCTSSTPTMFLKIERDANAGGDTLTVDARLTQIEFKIRRAM
jgi:hypothetical protein